MRGNIELESQYAFFDRGNCEQAQGPVCLVRLSVMSVTGFQVSMHVVTHLCAIYTV